MYCDLHIKLHLIFLLKKLLPLCALAENLLGGGVGRPVGPGAQEGRVYVVRSHRHHRHARPLKPELVLTSDLFIKYSLQSTACLTPNVLVRAVTACLEAV